MHLEFFGKILSLSGKVRDLWALLTCFCLYYSDAVLTFQYSLQYN